MANDAMDDVNARLEVLRKAGYAMGKTSRVRSVNTANAQKLMGACPVCRSD